MSASRESFIRFVSFAFASADLLLETETAGGIVFATGAAQAFAGMPAEALLTRHLSDLVAPSDRALVRHLLRRAAAGERVGPVRIASAYRAVEAALRALAIAGRDRIAVALSDLRPAAPMPATGPNGLLDRVALEAALRRHLLDPNPALTEPQLSLVALDGLERACERLPEVMVAEVMATIAAVLRVASIDGCTAGELGPSRYAVLHPDPSRGARMEEELRTLIAQTELAREVKIGRRTLPVIEPTLGVRDIVQALSYTLTRFASGGDQAMPHSLLEALSDGVQETMRRLDDVRSTIRSLRFDILYQPVVRLPSREVHHYEALARFAEGGATSETIRFAEEVGLIVELDLSVLRRVLDHLRELKRTSAVPRVAVNLSARSLASDRFVETLRGMLRDARVPARDLLFEITESYEIRDLARAAAILASLRSDGSKICLDDFGAGATAFHYIRHLSVDFVKLDGSFTSRILTSARDTSIVQSVIALCSSLGVPVIAEMIETEAECQRLVELGASLGQGWLFGRPEPNLPTRRLPLGQKRGVREEWA